LHSKPLNERYGLLTSTIMGFIENRSWMGTALIGECIVKCWTKVAALLLSVAVIDARAQSAPEGQGGAQETQARGFWTDPSTGLTWTARDNGKDVSWKKAMKYCRNLRLAGYADWRLANMPELQGIYDSSANAPGRDGQGASTWHVKGNLFLTGNQWTTNYRMDDRGRPIGYAYYFDFNEGKPNDDPTGFLDPFTFMRALCVRGPAK
jgi:hypothetical protein